jgi:hypothetical protein
MTQVVRDLLCPSCGEDIAEDCDCTFDDIEICSLHQFMTQRGPCNDRRGCYAYIIPFHVNATFDDGTNDDKYSVVKFGITNEDTPNISKRLCDESRHLFLHGRMKLFDLPGQKNEFECMDAEGVVQHHVTQKRIFEIRNSLFIPQLRKDVKEKKFVHLLYALNFYEKEKSVFSENSALQIGKSCVRLDSGDKITVKGEETTFGEFIQLKKSQPFAMRLEIDGKVSLLKVKALASGGYLHASSWKAWVTDNAKGCDLGLSELGIISHEKADILRRDFGENKLTTFPQVQRILSEGKAKKRIVSVTLTMNSGSEGSPILSKISFSV